MTKYTVLLLYPDYLASDFGQETYYAWVEAENSTRAVIMAQREAVVAQEGAEDIDDQDFYPLLCIGGHHEDLICGGEPVMVGE